MKIIFSLLIFLLGVQTIFAEQVIDPRQVKPPFWISLIIVGFLGITIISSGILVFLRRKR